jgi:hypothetical protein
MADHNGSMRHQNIQRKKCGGALCHCGISFQYGWIQEYYPTNLNLDMQLSLGKHKVYNLQYGKMGRLLCEENLSGYGSSRSLGNLGDSFN